MNINSQFAVGIHILTALAYKQESADPITSEQLAESVTTNPVVIRRIMGDLRRANLVKSQSGVSGGWRLTRQPDQITLFDIYQAVQKKTAFALPHQRPNPECPVGSKISLALQTVFEEAEAAMERQLSERTIADVLARVRQSCLPESA